jgi:hypothetical protein
MATATMRAVNSALVSHQGLINVLHGVSLGLGAIMTAGSILKLLPLSFGVYGGVAAVGAGLLKMYVDGVESDLETPVKAS